MIRATDKFVAILLALLLVLSPLQVVMADVATLSDRGEDTLHLAGMHEGMTMVGGQESTDCERCSPDSGCLDGNCASSHCASCMLATFPDNFLPLNPLDTPRYIGSDNGFESQLVTQHFRPPKIHLPIA